MQMPDAARFLVLGIRVKSLVFDTNVALLGWDLVAIRLSRLAGFQGSSGEQL